MPMVALHGHLCGLSGQECVRDSECAVVHYKPVCGALRLVGGRAEQDQLAGCTGHRGAL